MRKILGCIGLTIATTAALIAPVSAESWPDKPLTLVVPYPPGGSTDVTARLVAEQMSTILKQPIIIDNRPGAGGNIAAAYVARSAPDGYTMLMTSSSHLANRALYKSLQYDVTKDFAPVSQISLLPTVLVVNNNFPANDLAAFIEQAKHAAKPLTYGSAGSGTIQHLAGALFASRAGIPMAHIPYKGGAPALTDLMGGQIDAIFAPEVEVLAYIKDKRLKAMAVTTSQRSQVLPDVPAAGEIVPGYQIAFWNGILVPGKTAPDRVKKLSDAVNQALKSPQLKKTLEDQGSTLAGNTPEQFKSIIATQIPYWADVVKVSGAEPQ